MTHARRIGLSSSVAEAEARADSPNVLHDNRSTRTSAYDVDALRLRFIGPGRKRVRESYVEVSVTLARGDHRFVGNAKGCSLETIQLRVAATAATKALAQATGRDQFRLIGIKRLRAFDADVILVVLRDAENSSRRYVGTVAVQTTYIDGAVGAVLNAVNRTVAAPTPVRKAAAGTVKFRPQVEK